MIPLKDNIPTRTIPIITATLVFVNILIFLWQSFYLRQQASIAIYHQYGLVPREFISAFTGRWDLIPLNVGTLFTSMFLHGGFFHLAGNMLFLWIFGNNIEDALGHMRFIFFYVLSGLAAAASQLLYDPSSTIPMIGASGAISGVLGAYLLLYPFARIKTLLIIIIFIKIIDMPAVILLTLWFLMQVLYSMNVEGGVAWYAHIGGFIFGLIAVKIFEPSSKRRSKPSQARS